VKTLTFDESCLQRSHLRREKISKDDLLLIRRLGIRDWNGREFDDDHLIRFSEWVVNEDKSVVFKGLGGGAFEIPKMYSLFFNGEHVRLECGGGGSEASKFLKYPDGTYDMTVCVSCIRIPSKLADKQEFVLELVAEAFAVDYFSSLWPRRLLHVEFNPPLIYAGITGSGRPVSQ